MLVATWVLAVATAVLAISGPVALVAWWSTRRDDRQRRQREREEESADRVLKRARDEFVPKSWVVGSAVAMVIASLLAWTSWSERRNSAPKRKGQA